MKLYLYLILSLPFVLFAQNKTLDSLVVATYSKKNNDSVQMLNYVNLVNENIKVGNIDSILPISIKAIALAKKSKKDHHLAVAYNLQGVHYRTTAQFKKATELFNISRNYAEKNEPSKILCVVYINLSNAYNLSGIGDSSLIYAEKSYEIAKIIKDLEQESRALNILAQYYTSVGNFPKALNQLNKALKISIEIKDTTRIISSNINISKILFDTEKYEEMISLCENLIKNYDSEDLTSSLDILNINMGAAYSELKMNEKSLEYTYKTLSSENKIHKGIALNNIGETYLNMLKENIEAKDIPLIENINLEGNNSTNKPIILELVNKYLNQSIDNFNSVSAPVYNIYPLINLGNYYSYIENNTKAISSYNDAWKLAEEHQILNEQKKIAEKLYLTHKKQNNLKETLKWHEQFIVIKDSLNSTENQQEIGKQLAQFEYTNIRLKDSLEQLKKDEIQQIKIEQQNKNIENEQQKKYYLFGGLTVAILLLIFLFRRFNITKKQKRLIELQKAAMEQKQIELSKTHLAIKDSINYSKKIQRAIFPSPQEFESIFPSNFVYFKPKDVVSGDFYWCHEVGNKKIIVVADCTGHGVPGAFMTIIGINILKEIVQSGVVESAEMLRLINTKLKRSLGGNDSNVKDGMDLGICIVDDKMIEFSSAHFPLYHLVDQQLIEYKGDNFFLGSESNMSTVKTHYIPYKKGDQLFMITDGFPDQRGGIDGKKYFYKPLRNLLENICPLPLNEQKEVMKKEFENWISISNQQQMDDVTIVGIRL